MSNPKKTQKNNIDTGGSTILEKNALFSKSLLWKLQKEAYVQFGMQAWTEKGVPFYLTSNPHTAREYVNMVISYLQDCLKKGSRTPLDASSPIYIFDLGAGSGRFAYLFLKQLIAALELLALHTLKICYVITDFVQSNLDFCATHPQMQSYIQKGMLDFALYDHSQIENPIELTHHKVKLEGPLKNPAILIANYFFDTIPQDLFKVIDGKLQSGKITLSVPKAAVNEDANNEIDPAWINELTASYDYSPYDPHDFYRNSNIDLILNEYCQKFEGVPFLFPTGACQTIEYFRKLTNDRFLLLAGDQGVCTEEQVREWGEPHIALHGSFSVAVSYHAIKKYFDNAGGIGLLTEQPDPLFVVLAAVIGGKDDHPHLQLAFKNVFEAFEPSDYWKLVGAVETECPKPTLQHLLTLLKLGNWDPVNFNSFFEAIRSQIRHSTPALRRQLRNAIDNVWENFYPVSSEEGAFIMNMGVLLFEMKCFEKALTYFERAEKLSGSNPVLKQNIKICKELIDAYRTATTN